MPHQLDASARLRGGFRPGRIATLLLLLTIPIPATIAHAATETVSLTLQWTAPGDDSTRGRATTYDLRRSLTPITELNFSTATAVAGLPAPQPAGSTESFTVSGLTGGIGYYFALRTKDDALNWSKMSNLVVFPSVSAVGDDDVSLSFSNPFPNPSREPVHFAWSLPRPGPASVDVFDVGGRAVWTLMSGVHPPGHSDLVWDLRTDTGATVAPGVYLVRAKLAGQQWLRRVVVTR